MSERSTILWRRLDMPGHEIAELERAGEGWELRGLALLAHEGEPCRLEYRIECDGAWQTRTLHVDGRIGARPVALRLTRNGRGEWQVDGGPVPTLRDCIDVDLGFSPSTNLLPIRRLGLAVGERAAVRAAWVRFPSLTVEVLEQVYTRLAADRYRYESADGAFRRDLTVSEDGWVTDYPDFWRAEAPSTASDDTAATHAALVGADDDGLFALEAALRRAQLDADVAALDALIADELLFTGPDGRLGTKAQDLDAHRSGVVRFRTHEPEELRVRRVGANVAVTALRAQLGVEVAGTLVQGVYRYTRVWAREDGQGWRVVGGHVSAVASDDDRP
jgi:Uncharacterized protein conserved in bacteria